MVTRAFGRKHRKPACRKNERGADNKGNKGAAEHHLPNWIGGDQPFAQCMHDSKPDRRRDHAENPSWNVFLDLPCGGLASGIHGPIWPSCARFCAGAAFAPGLGQGVRVDGATDEVGVKQMRRNVAFALFERYDAVAYAIGRDEVFSPESLSLFERDLFK